MWPWNKVEGDLSARLDEFDRRMSELEGKQTAETGGLDLKILELERDVIQLASKVRSEVIELNKTTEVLSDRYLSWEQRMPELYTEFVKISEKMESIEFFQPVRVPIHERLILLLYNNKFLLSSIGLALMAAAGLILLLLA